MQTGNTGLGMDSAGWPSKTVDMNLHTKTMYARQTTEIRRGRAKYDVCEGVLLHLVDVQSRVRREPRAIGVRRRYHTRNKRAVAHSVIRRCLPCPHRSLDHIVEVGVVLCKTCVEDRDVDPLARVPAMAPKMHFRNVTQAYQSHDPQ